jgi:hypothetical protein
LPIRIIWEDKNTEGYQYADKFKKNMPGNKSGHAHSPAEKRLQKIQIIKKEHREYYENRQIKNRFIFIFVF